MRTTHYSGRLGRRSVCLGGGVSARGVSVVWTEFLTHACENITFPQLLLQKVSSELRLSVTSSLIQRKTYNMAQKLAQLVFPLEIVQKWLQRFGTTRIQHERFKDEECIDNQMQEMSEIISRSNIHGQLSSVWLTDPQKNVQLVRRRNWKRFRMCHFSRIILDTNEIHEHCCGVVSYCFVLSDLKGQTDRLDTCVHVLGSVHTELLAIAVQ